MSLVLVEKKECILHITLNRPEKKNALTRQMYQIMADAIVNAEAQCNIRVILIKGNGSVFTAGNEINDFINQQEGDLAPETTAFMNALANCGLPVVAMVQGVAVGIGTTMLLHCDFVYASENTRFIMPFIDLGLVPEYASSYILPLLAGHRKASKWLMLGESFGADEALECDIITQKVAAEDLQQTTLAVCERLAKKPKQALYWTKSLLKNHGDVISKQMEKEFALFSEALASEAAKEAFDAFITKRAVDPQKFK